MNTLIPLNNNFIPDADEIRLFAKVRNEAVRLPFFISYYRLLGIERFFIVDNGSTDDTVKFLNSENGVHVFSTSQRMSDARAGMDWIEPLLHQYGEGRWCVIVDADEILVYPVSESVNLRNFTQTLEQMHANAYRCIMIDMYPDDTLDRISYYPGQPFVDASPLFDAAGYKWFGSGADHEWVIGGPRLRIFYPEFLDGAHRRIWRSIRFRLGYPPAVPPPLNKVPLVRWNREMTFSAAAHYLSGGQLAKGHGALLHFKFLGDFLHRVEEELVRKAYSREGQDYREYYKVIRKKKKKPIDFRCHLSTAFSNTQQLVELGLMKLS